MWIAGAELPGDGTPEVVRNPATEEPLAEVPSASPEQVDRAVAAARAALGGWRRTPAGERGELLHGVAAWLRDHTEELGRLMALEGGKPLVEFAGLLVVQRVELAVERVLPLGQASLELFELPARRLILALEGCAAGNGTPLRQGDRRDHRARDAKTFATRVSCG